MINNTQYLGNSSINLAAVRTDTNGLICVTPFEPCCQFSPNRQGRWLFPNGSQVESMHSGHGIFISRGSHSIILQRMHNSECVSGVYTCEVPDINGKTTQLYAYLYDTQIPGESYIIKTVL